jgi:general secretion pathway protein K
MRPAQDQRGAALLTAMLTVALVATLASAALWQQWRQVEIEIAERGRSQRHRFRPRRRRCCNSSDGEC